MLSFILTISFLLHVILFIIIYYLFQQIQSLKQVNTTEVTDLFEQYLQEIRQENRRLETNVTSDKSQKLQENKIDPIPRTIPDVQRPETIKENKYIPPTPAINDHFEASLEAQILQLHHQGDSVEKIAQKLDCGKTEAALVIKFSERRKT